ncbi:MAG: hypothetical protein ACM3O3_05820 [Syntrophothermus sp.]
MNEINEDIQHQRLIKRLHSLQKVNAPDSFETNVMRRINSEILYPEPKTAKWKKYFKSPALIPSASFGLVAAVIFILMQFGTSENKVQNFLMAKPKAYTENNIKTYKVENVASDNLLNGTNAAASLLNTSYNMEKFTYKKIYLTPQEKVRLQQLKARIFSTFNKSK